MSSPAGWYDDGQGRQRWWDGTQWADSYQAAPQSSTSTPTGAGPYPGSGAAPVFSNQPAGSPPPRSAPKNFWGIIALIAGIVGIFLAWLAFGGVIGVAGIVFGFVGLAAVRKGMATNKGMNIWGIILSAASILLSIIFFVVYVGIGALSALDDSSGPGGSAPSTGTETDAPETKSSGNEFPVGDGLTMEVSISALQLDPPKGFQGAEPTQTEYDLYWDNAQETGGQLAIVTMTIYNNTDGEAPTTPVSVNLMDQNLTEVPHWGSLGGGYDLSLFNLEVPAGGSQTQTMAWVLPASEIDSMVVEAFFQVDIGEGNRVAAVQPGPGGTCEQVPGQPDDPFKVWTCLQKK
jgi:hypothetical protein